MQRHAAGGESASTAAPAWEAEEAPVVSRQAEPASTGAASPSSWTPAAAPELPPIRTVPAVAPSAVATPASRPLTQTAPSLVPLSSGRSGGTTPSAEGARSRPADIALPIQASGRVPTSVSPSPSAAPGAGRAPLAPVRRFAELPVEAPAPPVQREATGRRAGLGAPLPAAPDSAVAERLPMRRPAPGLPVTPASPAASPATVSRLSDGTHDTHDPAPAIAAAPAAPARPLPILPVARQRQDAAPTSPGAATVVARDRGPLRRARRGPRPRPLRPSPGPPRRSCPPSARGRCARP